MAKKEKAAKVSINAWEDKLDRPANIIKEWNGLEISILPLLSFEDMLRFVNRVTRLCFSDDTGEYLPELKDFAIRSNILEAYTNLRLPEGAEKRYDMVCKSEDLIALIVDTINKTQFEEMIDAINKKLSYAAQRSISEIKTEANKLISAIGNLQDSFIDLFNGIDNEKLDSLVKAITNDRLDESKLVTAYFDEKKKQGAEQ